MGQSIGVERKRFFVSEIEVLPHLVQRYVAGMVLFGAGFLRVQDYALAGVSTSSKSPCSLKGRFASHFCLPCPRT